MTDSASGRDSEPVEVPEITALYWDMATVKAPVAPCPPYLDDLHPYREFVAFLEDAYRDQTPWTGARVTVHPDSAAYIGIKAGEYTYKGRRFSVEIREGPE